MSHIFSTSHIYLARITAIHLLLLQQLRMASTVTDDHRVFCKAGMSDLQSLLLANTVRKYYIEYNGFMSNHISHGIIALYRLGATVEQIQRSVRSTYYEHIYLPKEGNTRQKGQTVYSRQH